MLVRFDARHMYDEFEEVGIPPAIIYTIDGQTLEIVLPDDEIDLDENNPQYYDITFNGEGYSITLDAISNYHLTEVKP